MLSHSAIVAFVATTDPSRAKAFSLAHQFDWPDTGNAEYVAVALLQADAFVTLDPELARAVEGVVTLAPFDALTS